MVRRKEYRHGASCGLCVGAIAFYVSFLKKLFESLLPPMSAHCGPSPFSVVARRMNTRFLTVQSSSPDSHARRPIHALPIPPPPPASRHVGSQTRPPGPSRPPLLILTTTNCADLPFPLHLPGLTPLLASIGGYAYFRHAAPAHQVPAEGGEEVQVEGEVEGGREARSRRKRGAHRPVRIKKRKRANTVHSSQARW